MSSYTISVDVEETSTGYSIKSVTGATKNGASNVYIINNLYGKDATFENTTKKGSLRLTKTVSGVTLEEGKTFYFTVSQTAGGKTTYFGRGTDGKATAGTEEKQYIELTVPAGVSTNGIDISDLVVGTYDVAEVNENGHSAEISGYSLTVSEWGRLLFRHLTHLRKIEIKNVIQRRMGSSCS